MERRFIATIDQGTTGTRFAIFNNDESIAAYKYMEHRQIYPKPGWVEHDPEEIWRQTQKIIKEILESSRIKPDEITAIGVTNQRETTVAWDPFTGKPYYNAIVWQCTRTREICQKLIEKGLEPLIRSKTGGIHLHLLLRTEDEADTGQRTKSEEGGGEALPNPRP